MTYFGLQGQLTFMQDGKGRKLKTVQLLTYLKNLHLDASAGFYGIYKCAKSYYLHLLDS